jgi:methyl-accepting chemotaxis protein
VSTRVPPWRRPRRLRRQITAVLAITALVAVLLFGVLNYVAADRLLVNGTTEQLETVAVNRARSIELGAARFLARVATTAADRSVVSALDDFTAAVEDPGRPGDLTQQEEFLAAVADSYGRGDLLLVDSAGTIVYSADDRVDPGTSLASGPLADTTLATLVLDGLDRVRAGSALVSNVGVGIGDGEPPAMFTAAAIRDGTQVVGTLVVELDAAALDEITTAGVDFDDAGLGDGQSYVVAANRLLQSTPESWRRDRSAYLDDIDDEELRALVEANGSPVGVQPIDTEPVRTALEGEQFVGSTRNALGQPTYASAVSIDVPGVEWVMVTEAPLSDVRRPLFDYLIRMGIVVAVLLPIAALIGFLLARRLTSPIPAAVTAARAVADGERHLDLPVLGNDEFGDLGRRLQRMAERLARQEQALDDEYERKRQLLLSVLPPHLVHDDGRVSGTGDRVDIATVVSMAIDTDAGDLDDDELTDVLATAAELSERLAAERGIDRVRVSADRGLFIAGAGIDDDGADVGLDFAAELAAATAGLAEDTDISFTVHVGVSTGPVATGVLTRGSLTFAAWGEPVRRALAISALSKANEILVDAATIEAAADRWEFVAVDDVVDLDGAPMNVRSLQLGVDAEPVN